MTMTTATTYNTEVEQIVQSILSTMFNLDVMRVDPVTHLGDDNLVTTIQITGEWVGSVVLGMCPATARELAAAMLHISGDDVTDIDQQDVAAELVNMVGGNLKSLLPSPSSLSLPTVVAGREFGLRVHDAEMIDDVWFGSETGTLHVAVYRKILSE